MFSYVFMKIFEARPRTYDGRMDLVSGGRLAGIKRQVVRLVPPGAHVLEVGCGTGQLAELLAERAATVVAFDANPAMCSVARERVATRGLAERVSIREMGVERMDELEGAVFGAVVATLVLSELHEGERRFMLGQSRRVLEPGGLLIVADEVRPRKAAARALHAAVRLPTLAATYLVTGSMTRPVENLAGDVEAAGLVVTREQRSHGDAFELLVASRPGGARPEEASS